MRLRQAFLQRFRPVWVAISFALLAGCRSRPELGWLAYVHQGNIWVRPLPAGTASRLTHGGGFGLPRFSSSGRWVACARAWQLYVVPRRGGSLRTLENGRRVRPPYWHPPFAWSPRQDLIAYLNSEGKLRIATPAGRVTRTITPPMNGEVLSFAWRPDGQAIAFSAVPRTIPLPTCVLAVAEVETGRTRVLVEVESAELIVAGWGPRSDQVLLWRREYPLRKDLAEGLPLEAASLTSGQLRRLAEEVPPRREFLSCSPPAQRLAVTEGLAVETWTGKRVLLIEASGESRVLSRPGEAALQPSWSPDGQRIAFVAGPDAGTYSGASASLETARDAVSARRVWITKWDGSELRRLSAAHEQEERPLWSADGRWVLVARLNAQGQGSLWVVEVASGKPVQVAPLDLKQDPRYPAGYYGYLDWDRYFDWLNK